MLDAYEQMTHTGRVYGPRSTHEVEVLLHGLTNTTIYFREDETKPVRNIPRKGIRVTGKIGSKTTLRMSERCAVSNNLA